VVNKKSIIIENYCVKGIYEQIEELIMLTNLVNFRI